MAKIEAVHASAKDQANFGLQQFQTGDRFFSDISNLRPSIQFIMEIQLNSMVPFLDVHVIRKKLY